MPIKSFSVSLLKVNCKYTHETCVAKGGVWVCSSRIASLLKAGSDDFFRLAVPEYKRDRG